MKLFISHASEDKDDFVRPLAERLKKEFQVWYADYELKMGDSLIKKISKGLASCDYGVVVLSPHFISKKWPQDELAGMFALESANRKFILPIWKDITKAGVAAFSPILADRVAVPASKGIEAIVEAIKQAVEVAELSQQGSGKKSGVDALKIVGKNLKHKQEAEKLLVSVEGANLVEEGFLRLQQSFKDLAESQQDLGVLKLTIEGSDNHRFKVQTNQPLLMGFYL